MSNCQSEIKRTRYKWPIKFENRKNEIFINKKKCQIFKWEIIINVQP